MDWVARANKLIRPTDVMQQLAAVFWSREGCDIRIDSLLAMSEVLDFVHGLATHVRLARVDTICECEGLGIVVKDCPVRVTIRYLLEV